MPKSLEEGRALLPSLLHLPTRIDDFQDWLEAEPCTHPGNAEVIERIKAQGRQPDPDFRGCLVLSNTSQMCPACRLRMAFFHCVYNASAYKPELGCEYCGATNGGHVDGCTRRIDQILKERGDA